jgi:CrcB protein
MPSIDLRELASIFAGGIVGGLLRAGLTRLAPVEPGSWPWTTLAINVAGAFALGYFATRLQERLPLSAYRRPLLGTGFCGALTTFSTVQVELINMLDAHRYGLAAGYASVSIVAGYAAMTLGTAYVRRAGVLG